MGGEWFAPGVARQMFLLRSAFWLTAALLVIKPSTDFHAASAALSDAALRNGQQLISEQIAAAPCSTLQCVGGKALLSAALQPAPASIAAPKATPVAATIALPRPRPQRDS